METDTIHDSTGQLHGMPRVLEAILTIRIGEPYGKSRGGWKKDVMFDLEDGFLVFREKCLAKVSIVAASAEVAKKKFAVRDGGDVYLKHARNDAQDKYIQLTTENFVATLSHRWKLLTPRDLAAIGEFRFEAFVYMKSVAPPPPQFNRATAPRVERAQVQRQAHEAAHSMSFGPIAGHHLDIVNARRPDTAQFSVPQDNTTAQAMLLDRQIAQLDEVAAQQEQHTRRRTATIMVEIGGVWVPLTVDVVSLRRALGLPDHDIFTSGIYHSFAPSAPTQPDMEDVDHLDEEEDIGDDDMQGL